LTDREIEELKFLFVTFGPESCSAVEAHLQALAKRIKINFSFEGLSFRKQFFLGKLPGTKANFLQV